MIRAVIWILCAAGSTITWGAELEPPFVAGFDRFFRGKTESVVGGRLLLSELSCTSCHPTEDAELAPKGGPDLGGAGNRLQSGWMRRFLASPEMTKPGTTMPNVLHGFVGIEKQQAIDALVAFLSTQRQPFPVLNSTGGNPIAFEFWMKGNKEHGAQLYHQLGCIACHAPDGDYATTGQQQSALDKLLAQLDAEELKELGLSDAAKPVRSVPHGDLYLKYTEESLTHFLREPEKTRPSGRMPSFELLAGDAADIAAYLLREQRADCECSSPSLEEGLIAKGRKLFIELRCVNCHSAAGLPKATFSKPLADLGSGREKSCLVSPDKQHPSYPLSGRQRESLANAIAALKSAEQITAPSDHAAFRMMQLNCYACHKRYRRGGVGPNRRKYFETVRHVDLGDEGRLPPPLSGVGAKLRLPWLKKVLEGSGDVRAHMRARMPKFAAQAALPLADQFVKADLKEAKTESQVFGDSKPLAKAGRSLMDAGCVQCHPFRGEQLPGVAGIDLVGVTDRIQPQWLHDFLLNPGSLKSRTRMPTFFPDGRSGNQTVLGGNVERQLAAMFAYMQDLPNQELPEKLQQSKEHDFELVPTYKPIVLRTFMKSAGLRAIAVGFPQQVHFAFDAEQVRVAQAWRGRFLDAHGTWFDRFIPPASPLGTDTINLPTGVPLARLETDDATWPTAEQAAYKFRGYRLDSSKTPTFLYRAAHFDIADRLSPHEGGLVRHLHVTRRGSAEGKTQRLWLRANMGNELTQAGDAAFKNEAGLVVSAPHSIAQAGKQRRVGESIEWILPLDIKQAVSVEVQYRW